MKPREAFTRVGRDLRARRIRARHRAPATASRARSPSPPRAPATEGEARSPCFAEAAQDRLSASASTDAATTRRPKQPVVAGLLPRGRRQGIAALQSHEQDVSQSTRRARRSRPTPLRDTLPRRRRQPVDAARSEIAPHPAPHEPCRGDCDERGSASRACLRGGG
jgi:hypothetical protein